MKYLVAIDEKYSELSVGAVLKREGFSRRLVASLKHTPNGILLNGRFARTIDICRTGDIIELEAEILYEDGFVIVYDKPRNMPTHVSYGHRSDTLSNVFAAHCPSTAFRCVNRLDSDTCGCVVCAKDPHSAHVIQRSVQKRYIGICRGIFAQADGEINLPVSRQDGSIITRCVDPNGKRAVTKYHVLEEQNGYSLVEFNLLTGRTHQIRVHTSSRGLPLVGDSLYSDAKRSEPLMLCCACVRFTEPNGKVIECCSNQIPSLH